MNIFGSFWTFQLFHKLHYRAKVEDVFHLISNGFCSSFVIIWATKVFNNHLSDIVTSFMSSNNITFLCLSKFCQVEASKQLDIWLFLLEAYTDRMMKSCGHTHTHQVYDQTIIWSTFQFRQKMFHVSWVEMFNTHPKLSIFAKSLSKHTSNGKSAFSI